jgi:hypothetical protein
LVRGAGLAGATVAVMAGAFQAVPRDEVPDASSTTRIVQQVGGSFGSAVLTVILANQLAGQRALTVAARSLAFDTAFWWAIGFSVLALLPALVLPTAVKQKPGVQAPSAQCREQARQQAAIVGDPEGVRPGVRQPQHRQNGWPAGSA